MRVFLLTGSYINRADGARAARCSGAGVSAGCPGAGPSAPRRRRPAGLPCSSGGAWSLSPCSAGSHQDVPEWCGCCCARLAPPRRARPGPAHRGPGPRPLPPHPPDPAACNPAAAAVRALYFPYSDPASGDYFRSGIQTTHSAGAPRFSPGPPTRGLRSLKITVATDRG